MNSYGDGTKYRGVGTTTLVDGNQSELAYRLLIALHDAINRPKGVVPASAEAFYDPQTYYADVLEW